MTHFKGRRWIQDGIFVVPGKDATSKVSGTNIKAIPHIESTYKLLKKHFLTIKDCLTKSHSNVVGLRNKEFPHFDSLVHVWESDYATGTAVETPADVVKKIEKEKDDEVDLTNDEHEE
nr:Myb_DNA-bind_3 domain-containing protein [Ipomoea batatas]